MAEDKSIFGYEKGMTIEEINAVSHSEAHFANEHTTKLLEVYPAQIDINGFNKYHIKLDDDNKIEQIRLLAYDIDGSDVASRLKSIFDSIVERYGAINTSKSIDPAILQFDSVALMENLNGNPSGFTFYWDDEISVDYNGFINSITLTIKADNDNTGFICVEITIDNSIVEITESENVDDASFDSDLLDGDDEDTIYENESNYGESANIPLSTDEKKEDYDEEVVQKESVTEEKLSDKDSNTSEIKIKKFPISISNLFCYAAMLIVWIGFLWEPIGRTFIDKQKGSWINVLYYIVYLSYTLIACSLPNIIKNYLNKFADSEKKEREALITGEKLETKEHGLWTAYKTTFFDKDFGIKNKTRASADLYFNYESVANTMMPDFPVASTFKLIAGSFMGLGILGTFIGFAIGLRNIDFSSTNTKVMLNGIEALVKNGLATAFNTSIVGVFCSLIYNFLIYNPLVLKFNKYFEGLSDSLDQEFYVSETEALMQYTMLTDENAQNITFSQSLRFIVENMNKQTDALNNFNDNLADKIANMNETVNTTLGKIATGVGTEVKDAVLENVHLEMDSLKLSLSDAAKQLGMVAEKIENTPELLGKANDELKTYLDDTRSSFSDMLTQNLEANRTALGEVVNTIQTELSEKFAEFSTSITSALTSTEKAAQLLDNIPEKIEQLETSFATQEADVAGRFETAASKLEEVSTSVNGYLESVENGITGILRDLTSAEENIKELLASAKMNEDNSGRNLTAVIDETNRMLEGFKNVDKNLKDIFEAIGNEIVKYNTTVDSTLKQYLSSFEDGSKSFSTAINGSIQEFEDTLNDLSSNIADVQQTSKSFDDSITKLGEIISQNKVEKPQDNK